MVRYFFATYLFVGCYVGVNSNPPTFGPKSPQYASVIFCHPLQSYSTSTPQNFSFCLPTSLLVCPLIYSIFKVSIPLILCSIFPTFPHIPYRRIINWANLLLCSLNRETWTGWGYKETNKIVGRIRDFPSKFLGKLMKLDYNFVKIST